MSDHSPAQVDAERGLEAYSLRVSRSFLQRLPFRVSPDVHEDVWTLIAHWWEPDFENGPISAQQQRALQHRIVALLATDSADREKLEGLIAEQFPWPDGSAWQEDVDQEASTHAGAVEPVKQALSADLPLSSEQDPSSVAPFSTVTRSRRRTRSVVTATIAAMLVLLALPFQQDLSPYLATSTPAPWLLQEVPPLLSSVEEKVSEVGITRTELLSERPVDPSKVSGMQQESGGDEPWWQRIRELLGAIAASGLLVGLYGLMAPSSKRVESERKAAATKALSELPPRFWKEKLAFHTERQSWLPAELEDAVDLAGTLRLHTGEDEVDVTASLAQTIRRGGLPSVVWLPFALPRELVLVVDNETSNGRWLHRVEPILKDLERRGATLHIVTWRLTLDDGGRLPSKVRDALDEYEGNPAMLISGRWPDLVPRYGRGGGWISDLGDRRAVLMDLDPIPVTARGGEAWRLSTLEGLGLRRYPWSAEGVHAALTWLGEREPAALRDVELPERPQTADEELSVELWAYAAALVPDPTWEQLDALRALLAELKTRLPTPGHLVWLIAWVDDRRGSHSCARGKNLELNHEEKRLLLEAYETRLRTELQKRERTKGAKKGAKPAREFKHRVLDALAKQLGSRPKGEHAALRWELRHAYYQCLNDGRWGRLKKYRNGAMATELGWLLSPLVGKPGRFEKPLLMPSWWVGVFHEHHGQENHEGIGGIANPLALEHRFWYRYALVGVGALLVLLAAERWLPTSEEQWESPTSVKFLPADHMVSEPPPLSPPLAASADATPTLAPALSAAVSPHNRLKPVIAPRPSAALETSSTPDASAPSAPSADSPTPLTTAEATPLPIPSTQPAPPRDSSRDTPKTAYRPALLTMSAIPENLTFQMGDYPWEDLKYGDSTLHTVTLSTRYQMFEMEVTQGQFKKVMRWLNADWIPLWENEKSDCTPAKVGDEYPVVCVTWEEATQYADALTQQERGKGSKDTCYSEHDAEGKATKKKAFSLNCRGYRLPTEAEWEYAARAGGTYNRWAGTNDEQKICEYGNIVVCQKGFLEVGQLPDNGWGLKDMTGNMREWVQDWYADYEGGSVMDVGGPKSGSNRGYRGGSWGYDAQDARVSYRNRWSPDDRSYDLGFRLSRSLP